jgi:hypothetical protein
MLRVRDEQMKVFEKVALRNFEDEMVVHFHQFAKRHCEVIGDENVREVIRLGMERAKMYGLTNRGQVRFYIELIFMFGIAFDTDPQLPWVEEILNSQETQDQMERAHRLYKKIIEYLAKVAGRNNEYAIRALRAIRNRVSQPFSFSKELFESEMLSEMERIYPQKCFYMGDPPLRALIHEGIASAEAYSIQTIRGVALFVVLMFALGHGFAEDPLFPWISRTLRDTRVADPDKRAERIEGKAIAYLDHVLAFHGQG